MCFCLLLVLSSIVLFHMSTVNSKVAIKSINELKNPRQPVQLQDVIDDVFLDEWNPEQNITRVCFCLSLLQLCV